MRIRGAGSHVLAMETSLLVMVGIGRIDASLHAEWLEQVETMRRDALPTVALRPDPHPSVLLDTAKHPSLRALLHTLQEAGPDLTYFVVWCALIASDLHVADTFLLVNITSPMACRFTLRFHLLRHRAVLERITRERTLILHADPSDEGIRLAIDVPDLGLQLAQVGTYQEALGRDCEQ